MMVMVNVCQDFSVITKIFTMVNDCWLAVILSAGFWLVKITNLLNKRNILFDSNVDWKKKNCQKIASFVRLTFTEWRSTFIHAEQMSLYNFIISTKKKRLQQRCFPVEFMKLSRTVVVASENM